MNPALADRGPALEPPLEPINPWGAWDRFWFKPTDPTTLAFIRVCAGTLTLYVHLAYSFGLLDYVGPEGYLDASTMQWLRNDVLVYTPAEQWDTPIDPNKHYSKGNYIWSIYFNVTDPFWIRVTHFGILVAMFLFTIGLWTRVTSVLTFMGSLCYLNRAPTTLFGMDTMMNLLLVYLMIGPSGAVLSVDRWLKKRCARRAGRPVEPVQPLASANFAIRMMQINFCMIYMVSGLSKLLGGAWWNGTAVWYTIANYSFAPMTFDWYNSLLAWLARHRLIWEICMSAGSLFTLGMEISLPYLIWLPRLRWFMICGSVFLHTGIGLGMGLVTFSLMMLCLLLAFVPPEAIHYLLAQLRGDGSFWDRPPDRAEAALQGKERELASAQGR